MCNIGEKPREGGGSRGSRACNGNVAESHPLASVEICGVPGQGRSPFGFNCKRGDDLLPNPRASYPQGEETRDEGEGIARKKKKIKNCSFRRLLFVVILVSRIRWDKIARDYLFYFFLEKFLESFENRIYRNDRYPRFLRNQITVGGNFCHHG